MASRRAGVSAALVDGAMVAGDVIIADGAIAEVGAQPAGVAGLAVPGLIDVQVNGFAGVDFLAADLDGYRRAGAAMAACGVTSYQPTLISSPVDAYGPALEVAAAATELTGGPRVLGVHLEGPFLAPRWAGAHDPANLVDPDQALAERLCAGGPVTMMTLAPERPGGLDLVAWLVARGVVVSLGHTDADAATAHAAYNRGAAAVTHLHNAQRRWAARDPGIAGVALTRSDVTVQVIPDGVHLAPETVMAARLAARGRFGVVTDAISAAGMQPGRHALGDREVIVTETDARLADGTLAGSVLRLDQAVRNLVDLGVPLAEAVDAASTVPARLLGRADFGTLRSGAPADLAVLDDRLRVERTLVAGEEIFTR